MEEAWINDIYETCIVVLAGYTYKEEMNAEDLGLQNLCNAVVYLYGKADIDTDRVYH